MAKRSHLNFMVLACQVIASVYWQAGLENRSPSVDHYNGMTIIDSFRKHQQPSECVMCQQYPNSQQKLKLISTH